MLWFRASEWERGMSDIALDAGERFAKVGELEICYQTFGRPSDPPLLLIAGLGAQMILFEDDFCAALAERGLWVVRYDNRDVGRSTQIDWKPPADAGAAVAERKKGERIAAPYLLKDMAADAVGLMDALGIARAHVVGASMGGMIAQEVGDPLARARALADLDHVDDRRPAPAAADPGGDDGLHQAAAEDGGGICRGQRRRLADLPRPRLSRGREARPRARHSRRPARLQSRGRAAPDARRLRVGQPQEDAAERQGADAGDPRRRRSAGAARRRRRHRRDIPGAKLVVLPRMGHALPLAVWPRVIDEISSW